MPELFGMNITITVLVIGGILLVSGVKIIKKYERAVVFRLGKIMGTVGPGMIYVTPLIDRMVRVDLNKHLPGWQGLPKDELNQKVQALVSKTPLETFQRTLMATDSTSVTRFSSGHLRARCVILLLVVGMVADLIAIGSGYAEISMLHRAKTGGVTLAEAKASDFRQMIVGGLQLITILATVIAFLFWIHRAHRNLSAFGARNLKYSPRWAVGGFFVPVLNFVRPVQVIIEIWNASDPNADVSDASSFRNVTGFDFSWQNIAAASTRLIAFWWYSLLLANLVSMPLARVSSKAGGTIDQVITRDWLGMIPDFLFLLPAVLAILVVRAISARQEEKNARLSLRDNPLPA